MKKEREIKNVAASVKERLRNIASQTSKEFQSVVRQYVQERFLFRLSKSIYSNNFVLKGALLFVAHDISRNRPTRDIDFLGSAISNEINDIIEVVKEILKIEYEDGVVFDANSVEAENIVEDGDYHGIRIKLYAYMENSRERVQLDIGFGDKITSGPIDIEFPTLLDFAAPKIKVYSIETAIAEKFEAIVSLQLQSSRMKDFYDILFFAENYHFKKDLLQKALSVTFNHRSTDIETRTMIFDDKFKLDKQLQMLWLAFLERNKLDSDYSFPNVVNKIQSFVEPIFNGKTRNNWNPKKWEWE
jgi:predicted nucleotidyltransferase component of viral defense system